MKLLNVELQSLTLLKLEAVQLVKFATVPQLNVDLVLDKSLNEHDTQMQFNVNHFWIHLQQFQVNHVKPVSHVHTGQPGPKSTMPNVTKNQHVSHLFHDSEHVKGHQTLAAVKVPIFKRSHAWQTSHSDHTDPRLLPLPPTAPENVMDRPILKLKSSSVPNQLFKPAFNVHQFKNQSVHGVHGIDNADSVIPILSLDKNTIFVTMPLLTLNNNVVFHKNQWFHGENGMHLNVLHAVDKWSEDASIHVHYYGLLKNNSLLVKQNQLFNSANGQSVHVIAGRIHLL